MMKNIFCALFVSVFLFGCLKNTNSTEQCSYTDSQTIAPDSQAQKVKAYLDSSGITAQKHSSGLYYVIHEQGTGASVINLCSAITVTYKGMFTDGTIFDSTATSLDESFQLGQAIVGWQKGIPLVNKGGSITLYIPPALGFGSEEYNAGTITIPGNSILIFDVEVLDISG